jgi:hypothetical protein
MNTVLNSEARRNINDEMPSTAKYGEVFEQIAIKQDAFTRSELAKAVREMKNPYEPCTKSHAGFHQAITAVLKVMEGK